MRGGKPYGVEVTGYYDKDKLVDIRVKNHIDPDRYYNHHKVSLDPPLGVLEQLWDLFTFDSKYTEKANKRVQKFIDPNIKTYTTDTKYIVVNDEDDIKKIEVNNILMQKIAALANANNKKKGGTNQSDSKTLLPNEIENYKKIVEALKKQINSTQTDKIGKDEFMKISTKIFTTPAFVKIVKDYFPNAINTDIDLNTKLNLELLPQSVKSVNNSTILNAFQTILQKLDSIDKKLNSGNKINSTYSQFVDNALQIILYTDFIHKAKNAIK